MFRISIRLKMLNGFKHASLLICFRSKLMGVLKGTSQDRGVLNKEIPYHLISSPLLWTSSRVCFLDWGHHSNIMVILKGWHTLWTKEKWTVYPGIVKLSRHTLWTSRIPMDYSWTWRQILRLRPLALRHIHFKLGNERDTLLWHDPRMTGGPIGGENDDLTYYCRVCNTNQCLETPWDTCRNVYAFDPLTAWIWQDG